MPLSRIRDKERKRLERHPVQPISNLKQNKLSNLKNSGLIMDGNKIVGLKKPIKPLILLPWCEWCQIRHSGEHPKPLPELDADGHPIPIY